MGATERDHRSRMARVQARLQTRELHALLAQLSLQPAAQAALELGQLAIAKREHEARIRQPRAPALNPRLFERALIAERSQQRLLAAPQLLVLHALVWHA